MLLVNVGTHILNVEQALGFLDEDDTVTIIFAADAASGERYTLTLEGDEADRMRTWLKRNAEGVRGTGTTGFTIEPAGTTGD
jgi:hypothetical protein